jgi:hypothetical protein
MGILPHRRFEHTDDRVGRLLQRERMRRRPALTFPAIRAIVQEIFTALLFAQQPDYYQRIQELQTINLRI